MVIGYIRKKIILDQIWKNKNKKFRPFKLNLFSIVC